MVSEFVVVWVELNWLRDVAGSAFFCEKGRPPGVCCLSPGLRRGLAFQGGMDRVAMAGGITGEEGADSI